MRPLTELIGRVGERFRDPRKKERDRLAFQFREKMEGLLGSNSEIPFSLTGKQAKKLNKYWERPLNIKIGRKKGGFYFEASTDISGETFELYGNRPRIRETNLVGERSGYKDAGSNPLDQEIGWLNEWIGYATFLEEHREELQTASPAPVAS